MNLIKQNTIKRILFIAPFYYKVDNFQLAIAVESLGLPFKLFYELEEEPKPKRGGGRRPNAGKKPGGRRFGSKPKGEGAQKPSGAGPRRRRRGGRGRGPKAAA